MGEHIVMLAKIAQEIPEVCDLELKIEGTHLLAIQQVYSTTVERGRHFTEASLEVKTSLHRDLEPMFQGPFARG